MPDFSIGLSGLTAIQKAINVIGNNIANAASEGYHKQKVELSPAYFSTQGSVIIGGGVEVATVRRAIDTLLEQEIYRQNSELGSLAQQENSMRTIENAFGDFTTEDGGLGATIDTFFTSLQNLTAHQQDNIWLNQFVSDATSMAGQFRTLGEYLTEIQSQIRLEGENIIENINTIAEQITKLNDKIESVSLVDGNANAMCDQRDQLISELSTLIGVSTINRDNDVVDVAVSGIPLVAGSAKSALALGFNSNGELGVTIQGGGIYTSDVQGGKLGGLISLSNNTVSGIQDDLDLLASTIIKKINNLHVQGVGAAGSFDNLTGWVNESENLGNFADITAGYTYIRVINTTDGSITRTEIPVMQNESSDSLSEIVAYINANVANVSASVNSSNQLSITAKPGYEFDFIPAPYSEPSAADINFNGAIDPEVTITGSYNDSLNDTLTFTVQGTGTISNAANLKLRVTNSKGDEVANLIIGSGYSEGTAVKIGETGLYLKLNSPTGAGIADLVNGDSFSIDVLSSSDTSGLLSATGLNTFFSGTGALEIAVCDEVYNNPARTATAMSASMNDNTNVKRMHDLNDESIPELSNLTCNEFYRQLVTNIGQDLAIVQTEKENVETMILNLTTQQSEVSGVDINDESAQLLVFQQMFQSIAKYMNTINKTLEAIMEII
ncbi:MAG: flagellar hook-associated protein FlgK [Phycisphaerales bacterium]